MGRAGALFATEKIIEAQRDEWVIVDDADTFLKSQSKGVLHDALAITRNIGVNVCICVKVPSDLPPWLASNADIIAHGNFRGPAHKRWAAENELTLQPEVPSHHLRVDFVEAKVRADVNSLNFGPYIFTKFGKKSRAEIKGETEKTIEESGENRDNNSGEGVAPHADKSRIHVDRLTTNDEANGGGTVPNPESESQNGE